MTLDTKAIRERWEAGYIGVLSPNDTRSELGCAFDDLEALLKSHEELVAALKYIVGFDIAGYDGHLRPEEVARAALSKLNEGERTEPEGWPDKCARCGAPWTELGYDIADGFNCRSCGGSDSDENYLNEGERDG